VEQARATTESSQGRRLADATALFTGLWQPIYVSFDGAGHTIVAEKPGIVKVFDGFFGNGGRVILDLQGEVANYGACGSSA
jgi:hypothetical protein